MPVPARLLQLACVALLGGLLTSCGLVASLVPDQNVGDPLQLGGQVFALKNIDAWDDAASSSLLPADAANELRQLGLFTSEAPADADSGLSRDEITAIIARMLGAEQGTPPAAAAFQDVPQADWAVGYLAATAPWGLLNEVYEPYTPGGDAVQDYVQGRYNSAVATFETGDLPAWLQPVIRNIQSDGFDAGGQDWIIGQLASYSQPLWISNLTVTPSAGVAPDSVLVQGYSVNVFVLPHSAGVMTTLASFAFQSVLEEPLTFQRGTDGRYRPLNDAPLATVSLTRAEAQKLVGALKDGDTMIVAMNAGLILAADALDDHAISFTLGAGDATISFGR